MCYQLLTDKFSLKEINNFESITLSDTCKNNSQYFAFHKAHSTIIYDLKNNTTGVIKTHRYDLFCEDSENKCIYLMIFEYAKTRKDTRTIFRYDIVTNKVEPYYCFDKDELDKLLENKFLNRVIELGIHKNDLLIIFHTAPEIGLNGQLLFFNKETKKARPMKCPDNYIVSIGATGFAKPYIFIDDQMFIVLRKLDTGEKSIFRYENEQFTLIDTVECKELFIYGKDHYIVAFSVYDKSRDDTGMYKTNGGIRVYNLKTHEVKKRKISYGIPHKEKINLAKINNHYYLFFGVLEYFDASQLEKTISKIYIYDIEKDILMPLLKNVSDCWFDGIIDNNKICYRENRDTKTRRRMIEHILEITENKGD